MDAFLNLIACASTTHATKTKSGRPHKSWPQKVIASTYPLPKDTLKADEYDLNGVEYRDIFDIVAKPVNDDCFIATDLIYDID